MGDTLTTLDLEPGMYVLRGTALVMIAEVTEPRHPAMPGLVVHVHYWREDEHRYNDRHKAIHSRDPNVPEWIRLSDDALPTMPDERYDVPDDMAAWRYGDEITIRQFRPWTGGQWPTDARGMSAIARDYARDHDMRVTCISSSAFGVGLREIQERRYRLA